MESEDNTELWTIVDMTVWADLLTRAQSGEDPDEDEDQESENDGL